MENTNVNEDIKARSELIEPNPFPIEKILNIALRPLPTQNSISKEAVYEFRKLSREFVTIITSEAGMNATSRSSSNALSSRSSSENLQLQLTGDDVIAGLNRLGYTDYSQSMKIYLEKYRLSKRQNSSS